MGDRYGFMDLVRYATKLIKNIEKYEAGIALVVTKVQKTFRKYDNGTWYLDNDNSKALNAIVNFLLQLKIDLESQKNGTNSQTEIESISKYIRFIDILLENDGKNRIGILRMISESGPVKNMTSVQREISAINSIINQNLQFISKKNDDFNHNLINSKIEKM